METPADKRNGPGVESRAAHAIITITLNGSAGEP